MYLMDISSLIVITVCWGVFALLYQALLRRETFFGANRTYLLGTLLAGLAMPIVLDFWPTPTTPTDEIAAPVWLLPTVQVGIAQANRWLSGATDWDWIGYLWGAGVLLAAGQTAAGLWRLWRIGRRAVRERVGEGVLLHTGEVSAPAAFFHWIFVPSDYTRRTDWSAMLAHEQAHVRSGHTFDVLLLEVLRCIFWFHPIVYWYRSALRQVHEYTADAAAARTFSRKQYGLLLIRQAQSGPAPALAHHFFQSPFKQRLIMLTKNASPRVRGWKYALLLPVMAIMIWCCAALEDQMQMENPTAMPDAPSLGADISFKRVALNPIDSGEPVIELFNLTKLPVFPGGDQALMSYLASTIHYPEQARKDKVEGKAAILFIIEKDGSVSGVESLRAPSADIAAEAMRVVAQMPRWSPGLLDGKPVRVHFTLPIRFRLE